MSKELANRLNYFIEQELAGNWAELARKSNITPSTLQQVKKGGDIRESTLIRISSSLNLSLDWLLTGEGEMYNSIQEKMATGNQKLDNDSLESIISLIKTYWEQADDKEKIWLEVQIKKHLT